MELCGPDNIAWGAGIGPRAWFWDPCSTVWCHRCQTFPGLLYTPTPNLSTLKKAQLSVLSLSITATNATEVKNVAAFQQSISRSWNTEGHDLPFFCSAYPYNPYAAESRKKSICILVSTQWLTSHRAACLLLPTAAIERERWKCVCSGLSFDL